MLESEAKALKERVKQAEIKLDSVYAAAIRHCIFCVNTAKYLTEEQKDQLITEFNK